MTMTVELLNIINVEIIGLDNIGYGPDGTYTLRAWREECLKNLLAGNEQFKAWQLTWINQVEDGHAMRFRDNNILILKFIVVLIYEDGLRVERPYAIPRFALNFIGLKFQDLNVNNYMFLVEAHFEYSTFEGNTIFSDSKFYGSWASFGGCIFKKEVSFVRADIRAQSNFESTIFIELGDFRDATFKNWAKFNRANFVESAMFRSVNFNENVRFEKAIFSGVVGFSGAKFAKYACFNRAEFRSTAELSDMSILYRADFENAVFENVGHFEGSRFYNQTPSFRGCKIDSTRLEFSDDSHFPQNDFSEEAIKNISFLKRLSDEHGQLDQALNFNAMELHAKRKLALEPLTYVPPDRLILCNVWWESLPTGLYGYLSNYGRSFTRPLVAFIILAIMTWVIVIAHAIYNSPPLCKDKQQSWLEDLALDGAPCFINSLDNNKTQLHLSGYRAAFEYSVYRTSNLVDFTDTDKQTQAVTQRLFGSQIEPMWMRIYGIFKAILSAILLFLTALGLRNKYRVG